MTTEEKLPYAAERQALRNAYFDATVGDWEEHGAALLARPGMPQLIKQAFPGVRSLEQFRNFCWWADKLIGRSV